MLCVLTDGVNAAAGRQRDRRPEELDEVVAQLKNLGELGPAAGRNGRSGDPSGGRDGEKEKEQGLAAGRPLIMDDDDDDGMTVAPDGTLLASTPARPL